MAQWAPAPEVGPFPHQAVQMPPAVRQALCPDHDVRQLPAFTSSSSPGVQRRPIVQWPGLPRRPPTCRGGVPSCWRKFPQDTDDKASAMSCNCPRRHASPLRSPSANRTASSAETPRRKRRPARRRRRSARSGPASATAASQTAGVTRAGGRSSRACLLEDRDFFMRASRVFRARKLST